MWQKIAVVNREIAAQMELTTTLEIEKATHGSDQYYEKIARDTLGLVYKNEIIFRKR